jgi:hypothetical protein
MHSCTSFLGELIAASLAVPTYAGKITKAINSNIDMIFLLSIQPPYKFFCGIDGCFMTVEVIAHLKNRMQA